MACIFWDDFEWAGTLSMRYDASASFAVTGGVSGMSGRHLQATANVALVITSYAFTATAEGVFSAACFINSGTISQRNLVALRSGTTINIAIRLNADLSVNVLRNATVIGSASAAGVVPLARRFRIEVKFVVADGTSGEVVVRIDSGAGMTTALTVTGVDTNEAGGVIDNIGLYNQNSVFVYWDDVYVDNDKNWTQNDFTFLRLAPSADVSKVSTPSTGTTAWSTIDESPASLTDFNTFSTTGLDVMEFANLASTPEAILGVGVMYVANKTITDPITFRSRIRSNANDANGTTVNLNATTLVYADFYATDPQGGGAWTKARVDAARLVLERLT